MIGEMQMRERIERRRDLVLLSSLLLIILLYPALDHGVIRRSFLAVLTFVPLILASVKMSAKKGLLWPLVFTISGAISCSVAAIIFSSESLFAGQWLFLTVAFGLSVIGLFSYLQGIRTVTSDHLYTAASIYLLLGVSWFALYNFIEKLQPGSFLRTTTPTHRPSDLLYFSLVTLTTLGYGDIVPVSSEARMLAALEAGTGVLYVAITVALLVSARMQSAEE
jgi:hypothetical protein